MKITLDINKGIDQNASDYFEKAKKEKQKLKGARETIERTKKQLERLEKRKPQPRSEEPTKTRKKRWYERFRWFFTSKGFLVIGGRDATTNEIIIKKHTEENDLVFHTDMAGSPFFVLKTEGKEVDEETIKETANATCTFSRAWKLGLQSQNIFYVNPDQVTKETKAGEFIAKGSFMIYGDTRYVDNQTNLSIGMYDERLMAGPLESIKAHCNKYVVLLQGDEKPSSIAKKIKKNLGGELDEIIRVLPPGTFKVKEWILT